ncbi:MAG: hydrogenase iron-sulfur subunit [Candidatus Syntropharchaeales archaeon]
MKIGVFLCECGGNIADVINLEQIRNILESKGFFVRINEHLCSDQGCKLIEKCIREEKLERVVLAACSPMMHGKRFEDTVAVLLNPSFLEIANIREQCAWVHSSDEATPKAIALIGAKLERLKSAVALDKIIIKPYNEAMVLGGGVSGITAALSLANHGIKTDLIEQTGTIGGHMVQIGKVFSPGEIAVECALCSLAPLMSDVHHHPLIELYDRSRLKRVAGSRGRFEVEIERLPRYVTEDCLGCGRCMYACPVHVPDECNLGMKLRRAIYIPFPQAIPPIFEVDIEACVGCGKCLEACDIGAIDLKMKKKAIMLNVGAIVVATGFRRFDLGQVKEYGYGRFVDVVSQMELARILAVNGPTKGKLLRPSDHKPPGRIVMIQCVGSRDEKVGNSYCSKICCMVALKHAAFIREHYPACEIVISYTDMRTTGFFEDYYRHAQNLGVVFIRGRAAEVVEDDGILLVRMEDTLSGEQIEIESDMVVLSEGLEASDGTIEVAGILGLSQREGGFIKEEHPKLRPVETDKKGIYVCGCAKGPKDITESVLEANTASARAFEYITGEVTLETGGLSDDEFLAEIDGHLQWKEGGERVVLAFLDREIGYRCADAIGAKRLSYPANIRIVMVPSIGVVKEHHLRYALERGVDKIILGLHDNFDLEVPEDIEDRALKYRVYTPYFRGLCEVFERVV